MKRRREQGEQFKMHMDAMIRRSCDDLQRTLAILYHEYLEREAPQGEVLHVEREGPTQREALCVTDIDLANRGALCVTDIDLHSVQSHGPPDMLPGLRPWDPEYWSLSNQNESNGREPSLPSDPRLLGNNGRVESSRVEGNAFENVFEGLELDVLTDWLRQSPNKYEGVGQVLHAVPQREAASVDSVDVDCTTKSFASPDRARHISNGAVGQVPNGAGSLSAMDSKSSKHGEVVKSKSGHSVGHHEAHTEDHADHEKSEILVKALKNAESLESQLRGKHAKPQHTLWWWTLFDMDLKDLFLEPCMGFTIILNILMMGIVADVDSQSLLHPVTDVFFCMMFSIELALRLASDGWKLHFCGRGCRENWFNLGLISSDLVTLFFWAFVGETENVGPEGAPSASLLRTVRIMRLTRILRVLKWTVFADLCAMMQGMIAGMPTLGWSMVLFFGIIYIFALVFREALGRHNGTEVLQVTEMFDSVPRSVFSTFRCSFGDCSSPAGVPIFEYVQDHFGWAWSAVYCMFVYLIAVGLFNVISAIFVEATMKAAASLDQKTKQERLQNHDLWSVQVSSLLHRLVRRHAPAPSLLFECSWEQHSAVSLEERLQMTRSENTKDIPEDGDWNKRLLVTANDGSAVDCPLDVTEAVFPVTVKLKPPLPFWEENLEHSDHHGFSIMEEIFEHEGEVPLSEQFREIRKFAYDAKSIDAWVKDPYVIHALDELDIDRQDHARLSDILDPQNDGQIPVLDLIDGIRRLRGFPRRSDIITIDLMIREAQNMGHEQHKLLTSVQTHMDELQLQLLENQSVMVSNQQEMVANQQELKGTLKELKTSIESAL